MSQPKLSVPNLDEIIKRDPKLGEAVTKIQTYVNANTSPAAGNKQSAPTFVTPNRPPG